MTVVVQARVRRPRSDTYNLIDNSELQLQVFLAHQGEQRPVEKEALSFG